MTREYEFAALIYDEEKHEIHCAACGRAVAPTKVIYKAGGRWVCGPRVGLLYVKSMRNSMREVFSGRLSFLRRR